MVVSKVYPDGVSHRDSVMSTFTDMYRDTDTESLVSTFSDENDDRRIIQILQQVKKQCAQFGESNLIDCKEWEEVYTEISNIGLGFVDNEVSHDLKTLVSLIENVHRIIQQFSADRGNMERLISHFAEFSGQSFLKDTKVHRNVQSKGENKMEITNLSSLAGNDPRDNSTKLKPSSIPKPNRQWTKLSKSINSFVFGKNAIDNNGDRLVCNRCCSTYHLARDCPDQKYHKVDLPCANFSTSDIQCSAVVSDFSSHTVCSWEWLMGYIESLPPKDKELVTYKSSNRIFDFSKAGSYIFSEQTVKIPTRLSSKETIFIETDVVQRPSNLPLILSRSAITRMRMKLSPVINQAKLFNHTDIVLSQAPCGFYQIPLQQSSSTGDSTPARKVQPAEKTPCSQETVLSETVTPPKITAPQQSSVTTRRTVDSHTQTTPKKIAVPSYSTALQNTVHTAVMKSSIMIPHPGAMSQTMASTVTQEKPGVMTQTTASPTTHTPVIQKKVTASQTVSIPRVSVDQATQGVSQSSTQPTFITTNHNDQCSGDEPLPTIYHRQSMQAPPRNDWHSQQVQCSNCQPFITDSHTSIGANRGQQSSCYNPIPTHVSPNVGGLEKPVQYTNLACPQPIPSLMFYNSKLKTNQPLNSDTVATPYTYSAPTINTRPVVVPLGISATPFIPGLQFPCIMLPYGLLYRSAYT